jgi:MFS transporter, FHS family, glucose/mannose:H+ symporter
MTLSPPRALLAALCCLAMALYAVYLGAVGVLLPRIGETFGLGAEAQGRLFPANFFGFVVGVLLCGWLSDRWGRKRVLILGLGGYAAGLALFGLLPWYPAALAASALIGAGSGALEVAASALAADLYPERRAFLLNAVQVAFGVGAAAAPSLVRLALSHGTPWQSLYTWLAMVNTTVALMLVFLAVPRSTEHEALSLTDLRRVLRTRLFALLCLLQFLYVGAEVSYFSWLPTYFEKGLAHGAAWVGTVGTVFWLAMTIGRFAMGFLLTRWPLRRLTILSATLGALATGMTLAPPSPVAATVFVALAGFFLSGIFSLILAEASENYAQASGTAIGGVVASGGLGGALMPYIVGVLTDAGPGMRLALLVVPLCLALLATLGTLYRSVRSSR